MKNEILTTSVPKELADLVLADCKKNDWSVSKVILKVLKKHYKIK